jgi:hypothetical protein
MLLVFGLTYLPCSFSTPMSQSHDKLPIKNCLAQQQLPCTATAPLHRNIFLAPRQHSFVAISTGLGKCKEGNTEIQKLHIVSWTNIFLQNNPFLLIAIAGTKVYK